MVSSNTDRNQTAFTISVDYIHGTSTGASAGDRALTARGLANPAAKASDFSRPGHLFPLTAKPMGVLERTGHTEASVDLLLLAGLTPVAVIGELMHQDGTMMRLASCRAFAARHDLPIINVEQLVAFRKAIPALTGALTPDTVPVWEDLTQLAAGVDTYGQHIVPFSRTVSPSLPNISPAGVEVSVQFIFVLDACYLNRSLFCPCPVLPS